MNLRDRMHTYAITAPVLLIPPAFSLVGTNRVTSADHQPRPGVALREITR